MRQLHITGSATKEETFPPSLLGWKRPQPYAIYWRRPFSVANHSSGRLGNRHNVRGRGHHKARHSRAEQTWLPNTFRPHTCFQWSERFERSFARLCKGHVNNLAYCGRNVARDVTAELRFHNLRAGRSKQEGCVSEGSAQDKTRRKHCCNVEAIISLSDSHNSVWQQDKRKLLHIGYYK